MSNMIKMVDGVATPFSAEDIAQYEADQAAAPAAEWARVRAARNAKLAACDWTQLPDAPVDSAAWATYRQALRDVTAQTDPFNITWPTPPAA